MIKAETAIKYAQSLLGTPYGSGKGEIDCINLIKAIIRDCPGGQKNYTDAHVPALWASYNSSGKYKHLIWRQEGLQGAAPGMLAFKGKPWGYDRQPSHIGIVSSPTTVIHASSADQYRKVVETDLLNGQWTLLGQSRYIDVGEIVSPAPQKTEVNLHMATAPYDAIVTAATGSTVNLREAPTMDSNVIVRVPIGSVVQVLAEGTGWHFVTYGDKSGYMMDSYLTPVEGSRAAPTETTALINEEGLAITLLGRWRVAED